MTVGCVADLTKELVTSIQNVDMSRVKSLQFTYTVKSTGLKKRR